MERAVGARARRHMTISVKFENDNFRFSYTGPPELLETKIRGFADYMVQLANDQQRSGPSPKSAREPPRKAASMPNLAQYFAALKPQTQLMRFLATAVWLQQQGTEPLTTRRVTETLRLHKQPKLGNASDCLHKNILSGSCERDGTHPQAFFVTSAGLESARADLLVDSGHR